MNQDHIECFERVVENDHLKNYILVLISTNHPSIIMKSIKIVNLII